MLQQKQNAVVYAYDVSRIVNRLHRQAPTEVHVRGGDTLMEFLIDGFIRFAIDSFEIVTVADYYSPNYTSRQLSWFAEQYDLVHQMWGELIFPSWAAGKTIHVSRVRNRLFIIIPYE